MRRKLIASPIKDRKDSHSACLVEA